MKTCVLYTYDNISLKMRNGLEKKLYRKLKLTFYAQQSFSLNHAVHEIMWQNVYRSQMTI